MKFRKFRELGGEIGEIALEPEELGGNGGS